MKKVLFACIMLLFATGCAPNFTINKNVVGIVPDAPAGSAQVVFVRPPCFVGSATNISVYDVFENHDVLLGVLTFKTYTIADIEPGKHTFWAHFTGSRCSYINADLEAGKTYYVVVRTWMGAIKGGLQIRGIAQDESSDLVKWMGECRYTTIDEKSHQWAEKNLPDLHRWCAGDYEKHLARKESLDLWPDQGLTNPVRMGKVLP